MSFTAVPIQMQMEDGGGGRAVYTSSRLLSQRALHLGPRLLTQKHTPAIHYMPKGYCRCMMVAPHLTETHSRLKRAKSDLLHTEIHIKQYLLRFPFCIWKLSTHGDKY